LIPDQPDAQLELFNASGGVATPPQRDPGFLKKIWGYEKTLLFTIGIFLATLIAFSCGVRKGQALCQRPEGLYIIQLGSFTDRTAARREGEAIKKYGFVPLFFVKGNTVSLCAGNFTNPQAAQSAMQRLSARYKGCRIIRRK
jgi:hypothetical protein